MGTRSRAVPRAALFVLGYSLGAATIVVYAYAQLRKIGKSVAKATL